MGDKEYYICLDCETIDAINVEDYEGKEWLLKHHSHNIVLAWFDGNGTLCVSPHQPKKE